MEQYYSIVKSNADDELEHYGVKGMKWGVRRNARLLANHRRNVAVRKTKNDYEMGKITASQKKAAISKHNAEKKRYLSETKQKLKKTNNINEVDKMRKDITRQTVSEVPKHRLKKGLTTANRVLEGIHSGANVVAGVAGIAAAPALGPAYLASAAVAVAAERGTHALIQMGLDKLA